LSNPQTAVAAPGDSNSRKDIKDWLQSPAMLAEIGKVLPKHITGERMLRVMLTCFLRSPTLAQCSRESLTQALMTCSQAGLEPDGRLAHLIPYGKVCQVIFDWKGLVALAQRNGYETVKADVVYEADEFTAGMEAGKMILRHMPNWKVDDRGKPYLFYCMTTRGGVLDFEVMTFAETEAIKQRSRAKNSGPWVTDDLEMRKKCPIRRMSKRWDLLPEIRDVILAEDDLPDDISTKRPEMKRPLFTLPTGAPEPIDAPPGAEPPPEPEQERPGNGNALRQSAEPTMATSPDKAKAVKELLKFCNFENITVAEVLGWATATDHSDGSAASLDELTLENLTKIIEGWPDNKKTGAPGIKSAIKAARAGDGPA
jgi:recombination protein RecT